tara:strand:- start:198 stop:674 length:477 start_codon:yes stop_codon:yes gene_type:complete
MSEKIKIPKNIVNKDLYIEARKKADESYKRHSAYKSMYQSKVYKELGGTYRNVDDAGKPIKTKPVKRTKDWNDEQWVQIKPFIKKKEKIPCGEQNKVAKACRPLKKSNDSITMDEIIKKWGKTKVLELTDKKLKDMDGQLDWKKGIFRPSKKGKKDKK